MKKTVFMIAMFAVLTSCGGGEKENKELTPEQKTEKTRSEISDNPIYEKGLTIIGNSDCKTCHLIEEKNIGPAWRDVANKYADSANAVEYLSHKIITGGSGVWGQVPMAPHPTMSQEDAETLAKFVLLLKNK